MEGVCGSIGKEERKGPGSNERISNGHSLKYGYSHYLPTVGKEGNIRMLKFMNFYIYF